MFNTLLSKFQTIITDPSSLFRLVILFSVAVILVHFLSRSLAFLFRLVFALLIIAAIVWFFF